MSTILLNSLELKALQVVQDGKGAIGWYQLERFISPNEYPGMNISTVKVLRRLADLGLISSIPDSKGVQKYVITQDGIELLQKSCPVRPSANPS